jgi:hypothetical protein
MGHTERSTGEDEGNLEEVFADVCRRDKHTKFADTSTILINRWTSIACFSFLLPANPIRRPPSNTIFSCPVAISVPPCSAISPSSNHGHSLLFPDHSAIHPVFRFPSYTYSLTITFAARRNS